MKRTWAMFNRDNEDNGAVAGPSTQTIGRHSKLRFETPSSRPESSGPSPPKRRRLIQRGIDFLLGLNPMSTTRATGDASSIRTMSFSSYNHDDRAQSEPPQLHVMDDEEDVVVREETEVESTVISRRDKENEVVDATEVLNEVPESQHPARAPSPAATEIEDPESQDVVTHALANGVKVRDFGFIIKEGSSSASLPSIATAAAPFKPAPEIFDQYKAIAEVDFRWTQPTIGRRRAIPGRSARRLLDMGWLTQEEWNLRALPVDIAALRDHDSRPHYPWRALSWTNVPTLVERRALMVARGGYIRQLDALLANQEFKDAMARDEEARAEALVARMRAKRKREEDWEDEMEEEEEVEAGPMNKRRRLASHAPVWYPGLPPFPVVFDHPHPAMMGPAMPMQYPAMMAPAKQHPAMMGLATQYPAAMMAPAKQYPAPLHTYNPVLYPDAARSRMIHSSATASTNSQLRPILEREDTPPLESTTSTKKETKSPGKGSRLVRQKLKRGLSRTKTMQSIA